MTTPTDPAEILARAQPLADLDALLSRISALIDLIYIDLNWPAERHVGEEARQLAEEIRGLAEREAES